ncbi:restriction endonuclease subunit S [Helicobacter winghamensis]|uniref:restriction endonuclease subunit S n=1 Tax=Helicobacter winghamensis TaxID=157268 RepID=UPI0027A4049B
MIVNLKEQHCENFLQSLHKEQWQEVRLGEVAEIVNGYAFKSKEFLNIQQRDSLPIIKIKNVANGDVNLNDVVFYPYSKQLEKFLIKYGDILVSLTGNHPQAQSQVVGQISKYKYKQFALLNQRVAKIVTKDAEQDFLYYLLKTNKIHNILASHSSGSANQANISSKDIENLTIPLPPLTIQQKIAEILSSFDDKIDLLHRQNKTLESLALTLFRHYFIDNPNRNEWEEKPLKYFGNIICGKTPPKNQKEYFNGTYPFIKIPDMHNNVFVFQTADSLTQQGLDSQKAKTLPPFSVCVSCIATIGVVSMNANIAQTNQQINSIVPYKEHYRYFLYCSMKSSFDELEAMASGGTATANLNTTDFSNMKLLLPREKEILRFHTETLPFFDKIYNNTKQIQNLQAMRDLMLRKIFN